jgi:hypothetical protein
VKKSKICHLKNIFPSLYMKANKMTQEIRDLANAMGIVIASVWDGYSRKWIVSERDGYYPLFTTTDYDTLVQKLRSGRIYPGQF